MCVDSKRNANLGAIGKHVRIATATYIVQGDVEMVSQIQHVVWCVISREKIGNLTWWNLTFAPPCTYMSCVRGARWVCAHWAQNYCRSLLGGWNRADIRSAQFQSRFRNAHISCIYSHVCSFVHTTNVFGYWPNIRHRRRASSPLTKGFYVRCARAVYAIIIM